ncbi:TonB-dependent receptor [Fulvivirga sp. M361]|uniref:SusC/RagA family TonB-linked outer membrane protein n=1 Tax=Fulvivirga sp. M361 TaxID=2594266 RepID=UPI00117A6465|nr:TonB-dependent receptor [Fulvivirga sp. M361]TRX60013.1 TonB-dependent receptor [Fulvivirga sp. M361]
MMKRLPKTWAAGVLVLLCLASNASSQVASGKAMPSATYQPKASSGSMPLKGALKNIEKEHNVHIIFQSILVKDQEVKTEVLIGKNVEEILEVLLSPLDLTFTKVDARDYVIKRVKNTPKKVKKINRSSVETLERQAGQSVIEGKYQKKIAETRNRLQERVITGKVIDENGQALPGVNILVKGTTIGTVADIEGNYTLAVPETAKILLFSFVGYTTETVEINGRSVIDIAIFPDITTLTEVVVVAYGETDKSELIGSVATIESKTIDKLPITTFEEALAGQVAGVNVRFNTSVPGGAPSINIRGTSSISEEGIGNQPLFVVDGFIYGNTNDQFNNPLAGIPPGDIASITVLKDAASASLYGSRASGGVILITTKSGKAGATRVSFDSYVGVQVVPDLVKPDVLNAHELARFNREKWMDKYYDDNGSFPTEEEMEANDVINPADFNEGTDWFDEITHTGMIQNYTISASGGGENANYFISANYFDQEGVVIQTGFRRYSIRANIDAKLGKKFRFGFRMSPSQAVFKRNGGTDPQRAAFSVDGTVLTSQWLGPDVRVRDFNGDLVPWEESRLIASRQNNPVYEQQVRENTQTTNQFNTNIFLQYEPLEGLILKPTFGISVIANRTAAYVPEILGGGIAPSVVNLAPSQAVFNYGESFRWQSENLVTYQRLFNKKHDVEFLGAFTLQKSKSFGQQTTTRNLNEPFKLPNTDNIEAELNNVQVFPSDGASSQVSFIGRIKYDFEDRYFATAAFRRDGSSRFGEDVRFANFPSLAAGWRVSSESFFKNFGIDNILNNVLLEASYGELGNNRIPDFRALGGVRLGGNSYVFGGELARGRASGGDDVPNDDLTWEETEEIAAGIDLGFFNNRIVFEADYYKRKVFNLLNNESLPRVTGFDRVFGNIGDLETEGLELLLRTVNMDKGKFKWNSDLNVTFSETIITRLGEDNFPIFREAVNGGNSNLFQIRVGDPLGLFYGLKYEGLYTEDDFDEDGNLAPGVTGYNGGGGNPTVGSAKFFDANENGGTDISGDGVVIGDANPDFTFGINNYFTYGPFSLKILMAGIVGQQVYDNTSLLLNNFDPVNGREDLSTFNVDSNVKDRWRPGDDPRTKTIPGTAGGDRPWRWANSAHVKDAGYLSIRNITLSFNMAEYFSRQLPFLKSGSVYFSIQNAFIFSPFDGNPEAGRARAGALRPNVNFGSYPLARTFTSGLRMTF